MKVYKTLPNDDFFSVIARKGGKKGFWENVDMIMLFLYRKFPEDMKLLEDQASFDRSTAFNKYRSSKGLHTRKLGYMPDRLIHVLKLVYEEELPVSQKMFHREFYRKYPKLSSAEKV